MNKSMILRKALLLALTLVMSGCLSINEEPQYFETMPPPLMTLEIHDYAIYTIPIAIKRLDINYLESEHGRQIGWNPPSDKSIQLNDLQYERVRQLLDKALHMPVRDRGVGPDGTRWTLKSSMYQDVMYSIWTPEHETQERGYTDLLALHKFFVDLENGK